MLTGADFAKSKSEEMVRVQQTEQQELAKLVRETKNELEKALQCVARERRLAEAAKRDAANQLNEAQIALNAAIQANAELARNRGVAATTEQSLAERVEFLTEIIAVLAQQGMEVKSIVEEAQSAGNKQSYRDFLKFTASDRKLTIGTQMFSRTDKLAQSKRHFRSLIKTISGFVNNGMEVREFDFDPNGLQTINLANGKLVIGPSVASPTITPTPPSTLR